MIEKAGAFNESLRATGILSCGKHFPGYASASLDPHHELPVIERSREAMEEHELAVFRSFTGKVDSMMIAHISISGLEPGNLPASLSPALVKGLLRDDMGFKGLIMTDDLDMGAILNHYGFEETMKRGVAAGNDLLMICHRIELAAQAGKCARMPSRRRNRTRPGQRRQIQIAPGPAGRVQRNSVLRAGFGNLGLARFDSGRAAGGAAQPRGRQTLACRTLLIP